MAPSSPKDDEKVQSDGGQQSEAQGSRKRKKPDISDSGDDGVNEKNAKDADGKNWKRILANRKSARESRIRRIKYMETLETSVEELTRENTALLRENQMLAHENFALRGQLGIGGGGATPGMGGMMDPSATGDAAAYRQAQLAQAGASGPTGMEGTGAAGLSSVMSPNRANMAASRPALGHPPLGMPPTMGMGMGQPDFRSQQDQLGTLEMIRRRQEHDAIPSAPPLAPPTKEEERLLNIMRKGREKASV